MRLASIAKVILPILLLAVAVAVFKHLKSTKSEKPKATPQEKVWQVDTLAISKASMQPELTLYATVESRDHIQYSSPAAAVVKQVEVSEGDSVEKGDLLVELDSRDFNIRIRQSESEVTDLEAQITQENLRHHFNQQALKQEQQLLELNRSAVARAQQLKESKLGADSALEDAQQGEARQALALNSRQLEIDSFQNRLNQLKARLGKAKAALDEANLSKQRARITARHPSIISRIEVSVGERVQPAQTLIHLYASDSLRLRSQIPLRYQNEISQALARGEKPMALGSDGVKFELRQLAGEAQSSGIDAFFSAKDSTHLRPGQLITLRLLRPQQPDLTPIPFTALFGNNKIYRLVDSRLQPVEVERVGHYQNGAGDKGLLIRSEKLNEGDQILSTHLPNAISGLKVKVSGK